MKNFSKVKALALDLDGTILLPDNSLSLYTVDILQRCMARGLKIILCTGRSSEASEKYRAAIGATGPMVFFNGAEIADAPIRKEGNPPQYPALLPLEVVDFCVDLSRKMDVYFQAYFPETNVPRLVTEKIDAEWEMYFKHTGTPPSVSDIKEALKTPGLAGAIKGMFITDFETQEKIRPFLIERFGNSVYVTRTLVTFLEIMANGISKGTGLKRALDRMGIGVDETIAFGDEENDLPMFTVAGFSVAPANAKEKVRLAADVVVRSNVEDGVAMFLEEQFLHCQA
ncbi:MAG: Cof-type HAD-IIB family hydrolase [Treponema sp.]|jgi:Cof subfamily protein (haloacid dehalogenase superfamily)|nr:Cof-type HAD-IIB family hydrolase [Treponema sp.]